MLQGKIQIVFEASQSLQKKLFAEGKNADKQQIVELDSDDFLINIAYVDKNGKATINMTNHFISEIGAAPFNKEKICQQTDEWFDHNVKKLKAYIGNVSVVAIDEMPSSEFLQKLLKPISEKELFQKQQELDVDFEKRKLEYIKTKEEREKRELLKETNALASRNEELTAIVNRLRLENAKISKKNRKLRKKIKS